MLAAMLRSSFVESCAEQPAFWDTVLPESRTWVTLDNATVPTGLPEATTLAYRGSALAEVTEGIARCLVAKLAGCLCSIGRECLCLNATSKEVGCEVEHAIELLGQEPLQAGTWCSAYRPRSKRRRTGRGHSRPTTAKRTHRPRTVERS
jgi:hypothetical protein